MKMAFFEWLKDHFQKNSKSVLIVCDLGYPDVLGLQKKFPLRVYNVGVAEQSAGLLAKGLCSQGFQVFIYGISSFTLWRMPEILKLYFQASDQLVLVGNGGGFGYGTMGTTHHSIDDLGLVSLWPHWTSIIPARDAQVASALDCAMKIPGPKYFRMTNNPSAGKNSFGALEVSGHGRDLTVVTVGPLASRIAPLSHLQLFSIGQWPLDLKPIREHYSVSRQMIILEEHQLQGGIGQQIQAAFSDLGGRIESKSVHPSKLVGSRDYLLSQCGLSEEQILTAVKA